MNPYNPYNEKMIGTIIIGKAALNLSLLWLMLLTFFQRVDEALYEMLVAGAPSVLAQYLGAVYLIFIVGRKGVSLWKEYRLAKLEIKREEEENKRSELLTEKQTKENNQ